MWIIPLREHPKMGAFPAPELTLKLTQSLELGSDDCGVTQKPQFWGGASTHLTDPLSDKPS